MFNIYIWLYIIYSSPDVLTSLFLFAYRICWSFPVSESKADIVCVLGLPLRASVGFVFQPVPQNMYEEFVQVTLIFFLPIFRSMSKHVQRKDQYRMNELLTIDDYSMYIQYIYIIYIHICICMQREDFTSMIGDFEATNITKLVGLIHKNWVKSQRVFMV